MFYPLTSTSCENVWICSPNFIDDNFMNKTQNHAGFAEKLKLKVAAVPTLTGHESEP